MTPTTGYIRTDVVNHRFANGKPRKQPKWSTTKKSVTILDFIASRPGMDGLPEPKAVVAYENGRVDVVPVKGLYIDT